MNGSESLRRRVGRPGRGGGGLYKSAEHDGHLVAFHDPMPERTETVHGMADVAVCDHVLCATCLEHYAEALAFGKALAPRLIDGARESEWVVGLIGQGEARGGQSPPWILPIPPTPSSPTPRSSSIGSPSFCHPARSWWTTRRSRSSATSATTRRRSEPRPPSSFALDALRDHGSKVSRNGDGFAAQCPAHDDSDPSLGVSEGDDNKVLLICRAGCRTEDVVAALGSPRAICSLRRSARTGASSPPIPTSTRTARSCSRPCGTHRRISASAGRMARADGSGT